MFFSHIAWGLGIRHVIKRQAVALVLHPPLLTFPPTPTFQFSRLFKINYVHPCNFFVMDIAAF